MPGKPLEAAPQAGSRTARLADEAAGAAADLRKWLASPAGRRAILRDGAPALGEELEGLLREVLALQLSIGELAGGAGLTEGLSASMRYLTARRAFRSDAEMAETLGVHRSQVTRWKQGTAPAAGNAERLVGLDVVVALLDGFLEPASIPRWLRGINAHLDHRTPLDVLREGRLSEVIRAIEAEKAGAFA